jgi:peroxiredoxin
MSTSKIVICIVAFMLASCGTDLLPSGADKRPAVQCGSLGPNVCQNAPDFTLSDSLGTSVTLSTSLASSGGVVLYFTMWCPVCDTDMTDMRSAIMPAFPNVTFLVADYVSGTVAAVRNAEVSNGYAGSGFIILADTQQTVLNLYNATMGTTVVIDRNGVIMMNESYKSAKLQSVLAELP